MFSIGKKVPDYPDERKSPVHVCVLKVCPFRE